MFIIVIREKLYIGKYEIKKVVCDQKREFLLTQVMQELYKVFSVKNIHFSRYGSHYFAIAVQ